MKIEIVRSKNLEGRGVLNINGKKFCDTFENSSKIPAGVYQIVKARFEPDSECLPAIENVPGFGRVFLDYRARFDPSPGCIRVGFFKELVEGFWLVDGYTCMAALSRLFAKPWRTGEVVEVEIREEYGKS